MSLVWTAPKRNDTGSRPPALNTHSGSGHPISATILVIEDEVLIRLAVSDYLRRCGYRVVEGSTAEEAQRVLRAGEPVEILFSDINLGSGMDGFALASWVRDNFPAVRILLTSGIALAKAETAQVSDGPFLSKPYSHEGLGDRIRRLLDLANRPFD